VSARLTLEVAAQRLDEVRTELVAVAFFETDRPLRGAAGRADWRLCGALTRLLIDERMSGAADEAVLVAIGRGWNAPRLLGLGLGERRDFEPADWEALGRSVALRAARLRSESVAFPVCDPDTGRVGVRERVGALLRGAVSALAENSAALRFQLVVGEAEAEDARAAVQHFARARTSPAVELEIGDPRTIEVARSLPQGVSHRSLRGTQVFK